MLIFFLMHLSIFNAFTNGHAIPAHFAPQLRSSSQPANIFQRAITGDLCVVQGPSVLSCSAEQLTAIDTGIEDAKTLARNAANALGKDGAETSPAYERWFGPGIDHKFV